MKAPWGSDDPLMTVLWEISHEATRGRALGLARAEGPSPEDRSADGEINGVAQVPADEAQQYSRYQGYNGQQSGESFGGVGAGSSAGGPPGPPGG